MKKFLLLTVMVFSLLTVAYAQDNSGKTAKMVFKETTHDFGQFSESSPQVSCVFEFKNEGDAPLVIHQAVASCGCTVPSYPKTPIKPGESGNVQVTYNGKGKYPGHFKKSIRLRTNGEPEVVTIYIQGEMLPAEAKANK